jgi:PAS domain S-box-containing protein
MIEKEIRVGVFIGSGPIIDHVKRLAAIHKELSVDISHERLNEAIPIGKRMEQEGTEVVISRRGTAFLLRENLQIPVLSLPQSELDIILALRNASALGTKILLTSFRNKYAGIEALAAPLNLNFLQKTYEDSDSLEAVICKAHEFGCDVVVGGPKTVEFARGYGLRALELQTSEEMISATFESAKSVVKSNRDKHEESIRFHTIINATSEGMLSVDRKGIITAINSTAMEILGVSNTALEGGNISEYLIRSKLNKTLAEGRFIQDSIEEINGESYVFNHIPIIAGGDTVGAVSTFKHVNKVIKSENVIRKKLTKGHHTKHTIQELVSSGKEMEEVKHKADRFAKTDTTILIMGETGTGKEILSQSIHNLSSRSKKPFVSVNCAALPAQLLESELFGYEEGAFTGAKKGGKPGLFEIAHTGTIFLDEISTAPMNVQMRLLRILQEREVMRLGSDELIPIDVRVIAAANQDLSVEIQENRFRSDLFFRLNVLNISIPPLNQRADDIPLLAYHFIKSISTQYGYAPFRIPTSYLNLLTQYAWPGNVRQLRNFIERLVLLSSSRFTPEIFKEIYSELLDCSPCEATNNNPVQEKVISLSEQIKKERNESEARLIKNTLIDVHFIKSEAAQKLGMSRTTLWRKMKEFGLN